MPQKLVKFHRHKHKLSAWITQGIITSIQYREKLCMNHKMIVPNSVHFSIQKINLKTYNGIVKKIAHWADEFYRDAFGEMLAIICKRRSSTKK